MYQIEYLDIPENKEYEKIIKKVVEECFKEEEMDEIDKEFYDTIKKERVMIYG